MLSLVSDITQPASFSRFAVWGKDQARRLWLGFKTCSMELSAIEQETTMPIPIQLLDGIEAAICAELLSLIMNHIFFYSKSIPGLSVFNATIPEILRSADKLWDSSVYD